MIADERIAFVAFTGSVAGGQAVQRAAADRFIGTGLELGGKDAAYVRADAALDHAVENIVDGAFFNAGQSCCSVQRVYVDRGIYDRFVDASVALTNAYLLGDPRDPATTIGPMVRADAAESVRGQVQDAIRSGAKPLVDQARFPAEKAGTAYMAPRILANVSHDMRVLREETFGPVMTVMRGVRRRRGRPSHQRQPLWADVVGVDDGRGCRNPYRGSHRDGNVVHEPLRLSRSRAGVDGGEGFRARLHALTARDRGLHAPEVVPPAAPNVILSDRNVILSDRNVILSEAKDMLVWLGQADPSLRSG